MRRKYVFTFLSFILLLMACTPEVEKETNKLLSSGVQYIGGQQNIINKLETLPIEYKNVRMIDLSLEEYKFVIIEPNFINNISKELVVQALQANYYLFFINVEDPRLIKEAFLHTGTIDDKKRDKIWAEQLYLEGNQLKSFIFSIEPNFDEELLEWLQYFDQYKVRNRE
ncbi:hypothetical protein [Ornithinibacillus halotolerans]|uniref:Uncharacterized protein n=1 Tax=Ornithinibacillus halotolerans TaxID=1274357 RepID=A0A916RWC0_9BACI|nr:hypothetical protein [Ornithinibacillus halotolerans]GGA73824.1 hypothetical protein GCM10008025_16900 [Ornithinibacillus halotolerans]